MPQKETIREYNRKYHAKCGCHTDPTDKVDESEKKNAASSTL